MIKTLLQTGSDYVYSFLRIIAGIIVFPYGMQKLFGWFSAPGFGPPGINVALAQLTARNIPRSICVAHYPRAVVRKYCPYVRLFRKNRGQWTVHHLHRCTHSSSAGWVDTELVWIKKGRRN